MAKITLTKEEKRKEILKCGNDPVYFLKNYAYIPNTVDGRLILFDTYDFQDKLLKDFRDHRFNIILKSRQMGISTITAGYITWLMLFHRQKNVLVLATKLDTASNLVKAVKTMIKNVPEWMRIAEIDTDNKNSFSLNNGSQIKASASSSSAGRSEALALLVIDEAAHVEDLDELWAAIYPTIATGGRCIALSTPNGIGNWFHDTYIKAEQAQNAFKATHLPWSVHPKRDQAWFDQETKNMNPRFIAQEYNCAFNGSGDTVVPTECLQRIEKEITEPLFRTYMDRNLHVWEDFDPSKTYLLSADVARGDGEDYSVFHVINATDMVQVAEYQGKIELDAFARLLMMTGRDYGNCLISVENNNIGYAVLTKLIEWSYPNIYYSTRSITDYSDERYANQGYIDGTIPGFATSVKTRPLIIAKLDEYIRGKSIKINSKRTFREMETFLWINGKPQAAKGKHDDLIMSLAIACWIRDTTIIQSARSIESTKALLNIIGSKQRTLNTSVSTMVQYDKNIKLTDAQKDYFNNLWIVKG